MKTMDYSRWFGDPQSPPDVVEPRPWREVSQCVSFFVIFILLVISDIWPRYNYYPGINPKIFSNILSITGLGLFLGFLILGVVRKFPDWSLPFVGFAVSILSALTLLAINDSQPTFLVGILFFISPAVAILIARFIKPLQPLWQAIWQDPTRLSLVYMGLMVLGYTIVLDDVPYEEFVVSSCIVLVIPFATLYLRSRRLWQRVLIPPIGFLVAWIFCVFYSFDLLQRPFWFGWNSGIGMLSRIGLLILLWFLAPGLWILLRRVKWITPIEA